jgi:hypothetical protein
MPAFGLSAVPAPIKNRMTLPGCHGAITAAAHGAAVGEAMAAAMGRPTGATPLLTDAAGNADWGTLPSVRRLAAGLFTMIGSDTTGSLLSPGPGRDSAPLFGLVAAITCPFRTVRPGSTAVTSTVRGLEFGGAEIGPGVVEAALREPRSAVRVGPADPGAFEEPVDRDGPVDPGAFEESVAPDAPADPEVSANADGIAARKEPTPRAIARAPTRPT